MAATGTTLYAVSRPHHAAPDYSRRPKQGFQNGIRMPTKFPSIKSREEQISDLKRTGQHKSSNDNVYDLLVVGGGATGTGIALDAATRGLKVALVERDDFSSGTSSKSTKLVHGGVRYLEKAVWNLDYSQYQLVVEALRERKNFLYTAPHLSSWLPVLLPLQKWWQAPYFWAGTKMYDFLAGSEGNPPSYYLPKSKAIDAFPMLKKDNCVGALVYYDGQHNDSRMNVSLAMTASLHGATVVNHMEVTSLEKDAGGKLCGARVRDMITGDDEFQIRARGIINATGPFCDAITQMDEPHAKELVAPSEGTHLVLPGYLSPKNMGLLDAATSDGRVMFFLPWQGNIIAGTTDAPCRITKSPIAKEEDISWILKELSKYLTQDVDLQRSDVLAAWSGIRPLVRDPKSKNTESLVRNHLVTVSKSGLLTCAGGKWTTYRQMAEDAVDEAICVFSLHPQPIQSPIDISGTGLRDSAKFDGTCQTQGVRLIGAHGFYETLFVDLIRHYNINADIAKHLSQSYGDRAWAVLDTNNPQSLQRLSPSYPFIQAEIPYAIAQESARTATDFLARRTRLSFLDVHASLAALPTVIDLMGDTLQWTPERRQAEWTTTVDFLRTMGLPAEMMDVTREQVQVLGHQQPQRPRQSASHTFSYPAPTQAEIKKTPSIAEPDPDRPIGFEMPAAQRQ